MSRRAKLAVQDIIEDTSEGYGVAAVHAIDRHVSRHTVVMKSSHDSSHILKDATLLENLQ
jgi:hypothetical protein